MTRLSCWDMNEPRLPTRRSGATNLTAAGIVRSIALFALFALFAIVPMVGRSWVVFAPRWASQSSGSGSVHDDSEHRYLVTDTRLSVHAGDPLEAPVDV